MATVDKIKDFLLDIFFPRFCFGCKKEGTYLCDDCKAILEISEYNYCLCEKNPLRLPSARKCQRCQSKKLSGLYFALPFQESSLIKKMIYQFKYEPYVRELAKPLASLVVDHLLLSEKNLKEFENGYLIPVPIDKKKLKKRGFNQAEELAKELSIALKIPVFNNVLTKIKQTTSQMELIKEEREKNLKGAFSCVAPEMVKNKKIFLVDDVYTTGSTMEECAKVLKESEVKSVWGIVIAREG